MFISLFATLLEANLNDHDDVTPDYKLIIVNL